MEKQMDLVSSNAPKHEFTLLADDIRQEMGGKTSLMGLYDHHIVVPQIPYVLPKVCFYTRFSKMTGSYKFSFAIKSPSSDVKTIIDGSEVSIPDGAKEGTFNVVASPFDVSEEGLYEVTLTLVKDEEPFEYTYQFAISNAQRLQAEYEAAMNATVNADAD
jgi:hypothetical protein